MDWNRFGLLSVLIPGLIAADGVALSSPKRTLLRAGETLLIAAAGGIVTH